MALVALLAGCGGGDNTTTNTGTTGAARTTTEARTTTQNGSGGGPVATGDGRGGVALEKVGDFSQPLYVTAPPRSSDLFVVEQTGRVLRLPGGDGDPQVFLDVSDEISCCSEQGLLSVAFAPDYARSGLFYVDYTDTDGDTRVVEYRSDESGEQADPDSARVVLRVDQPFPNHNGGLLLFGPDGELYVGLGDGGSGGDPQRNGQDLSTLLGKILRIDPEPSGGRPYSVPKDNPFVGREGARPEIFDYGLRNPWRFSFDPKTRALWIGDVGQDTEEEIDYLAHPAGANLGWSAFEGDLRFNQDQQAPDAVAPVLTYRRDRGCSVTGGYVVRDRALASLYGRYLYGDFCEGQLRSFDASQAPGPITDDRDLGLEVPNLSSFGEDSEGRVYATSLHGAVYRLVPAG
jgi:glucose/arabinose dehydrogenase